MIWTGVLWIHNIKRLVKPVLIMHFLMQYLMGTQMNRMMMKHEMTSVIGDPKPGYQLFPLVDNSIESIRTRLGPKSSIITYSDLMPIVCPLFMRWEAY